MFKTTGKRTRTPIVLAEALNAGHLRDAAEQKNDARILVQIQDKDCIAIEVRYHRVCYSNYTKFLTRHQLIDCEKSVPVYEESFAFFCKEVIEKKIIEHKQIRYLQDLLKQFVNIAEKMENVDASNYRSNKLKQRLQKKYPELVFCPPKVRSVSEIVFVENFTSMELVKEHSPFVTKALPR